MATVSIILRKDKTNKKGEAPIHFRVIKDRRNTNIASGISIPEDCWDEKNKRVKSKHKNSARMNAYISTKYKELMDNILEHETFNKSTTTRKLKEAAFGKAPADFFQFAERVLQRFEMNGQISTLDKNRSTIKKFREFFKAETVYFQEITPELLQKYEGHLRKKYGNTTNTVHKNLKFIRQIFNEAIHQDLIEIQVNPFNKYKLRLEKTQRSYLTEEELKAFEGVKVEKGSTKEIAKDMFIFASYTGGPRVSDVLSLQWNNYNGEYVAFTIKKTNSQITIKVPTKGLEILEKYKKEGQLPTDFIFPLLPNTMDMNNPRMLDKMISSKTTIVNKQLKDLATDAGIDKNLSFHISRHTWATRALRKGVSIDKVSKLMGHAAIKETQVYAKIVNEELDKAMDVFND